MDDLALKNLTAIPIQPDNGEECKEAIVLTPVYTLGDMTLYEFNESADSAGLGIDGATLKRVFPEFWFQKGKAYVFSKGDTVYTY
jgi:hypothetical protein